MILDGKRYLYPNLNKKKYLIKICKNNLDNKNMILFLEKNLNKNLNVSLDFEFNRNEQNTEREIALMQICIDTNNESNHIYLLYPPSLKDNELQYLKLFLMNDKVNKIIHGGESLDIPYLFKNFFTNKNEQILFTKNLYDTKFLCEYYNIYKNFVDRKCKIYYLLKNMNVVDNKQFNFLINNEKQMGSISDIKINYKDLSKELILYSTFDVLFLSDLFVKFKKTNINFELLSDVVRIHYILKQTEYFSLFNSNISELNNNYFIINNKKYIFYDNFKYYIEKLNITEYTLKIFLKINYIKKFFMNILKSIIYSFFINNYKSFKKKNILNSKIVNYEYYIDKYTSLKDFTHLYLFCKKIEKILHTHLNVIKLLIKNT